MSTTIGVAILTDFVSLHFGTDRLVCPRIGPNSDLPLTEQLCLNNFNCRLKFWIALLKLAPPFAFE